VLIFVRFLHLVRAAAIEPLIAQRHPSAAPVVTEEKQGGLHEPAPVKDDTPAPSATAALTRLRVRIDDVPSSKARELIRAAVLPLAKSYTNVTLDITINAAGGEGATRSDLDMIVLEGLRQLGIEGVSVDEL
jgi:hypothetical protein